MRKAYIVHAASVADAPTHADNECSKAAENKVKDAEIKKGLDTIKGEKKEKVLEIKNDFGRSFFAI